MSLTVRFIKQHKHLGLTLPLQANNSHPPLNVKIHIDNDVEIKIVSPNANGLIPFPTHLVPVAMPAGVPDTLTFLTAERNFNLGTDKLVFVPPTGFGNTNFYELHVTSNNNATIAQLQPVAGPHGFGGGAPAGPAPAAAAAYAAAPVHVAMPAHAAVQPRAVAPARAAVSAQSVGSTRVALPTGAAVASASASSASSAFSAAASASSTPRHGYAANRGAATRQFATRGRKR